MESKHFNNMVFDEILSFIKEKREGIFIEKEMKKYRNLTILSFVFLFHPILFIVLCVGLWLLLDKVYPLISSWIVIAIILYVTAFISLMLIHTLTSIRISLFSDILDYLGWCDDESDLMDGIEDMIKDYYVRYNGNNAERIEREREKREKYLSKSFKYKEEEQKAFYQSVCSLCCGHIESLFDVNKSEKEVLREVIFDTFIEKLSSMDLDKYVINNNKELGVSWNTVMFTLNTESLKSNLLGLIGISREQLIELMDNTFESAEENYKLKLTSESDTKEVKNVMFEKDYLKNHYWKCSYCGSLVDATNVTCVKCGASRLTEIVS